MAWVKLPEQAKRFVSPEGKSGDFTVFKGRVVGASVWSETEVTSSGGGGSRYVHPQYGGQINVAAPVISSYAHEKREVFVADGGVEQTITLRDIKFPVREGHVVSVGVLTLDSGPREMVWLMNHTTDNWVWISMSNRLIDALSTKPVGWIRQAHFAGLFGPGGLVFGAIVFWFTTMIFKDLNKFVLAYLLAAVAVHAYWFVSAKPRRKAALAAVGDHVRSFKALVADDPIDDLSAQAHRAVA
jgi:hypothetical protein